MTISTDDKIEIMELFTSFYTAADGGDAAGFAATFVDDGIFVIRKGGKDAPHEDVVGPDAIKVYGARFSEPERVPSKHFVTNFTIMSEGAEARVTCSILNVEILKGPTVIGTALGDCLVRRTGKGWRFVRFDHYIDPAYLARY